MELTTRVLNSHNANFLNLPMIAAAGLKNTENSVFYHYSCNTNDHIRTSFSNDKGKVSKFQNNNYPVTKADGFIVNKILN